MANFCTKCGSPMNQNGLCPRCDAPVVPLFCTKCGTPKGADGRCPHCDVTPSFKFCTTCGAPKGADGRCPHCDVTPTFKFCTTCGAPKGADGLCPNCDAVTPAAPTEVLSEDSGATVLLSEDPGATVLLAEEPVEPVIAPAPQPVKKASAVTVIITVLLSICLFITTTLSVSVLTVRHTISEGGMENLAEQVDIAEMLKTTGAANGETFNTFYERLQRDYGVELDDEKLGEMLEDSTVPEYVAEKISDFAEDFFAGEAELVITKDEMVDLVWDNRKLIEDEIPDDFEIEIDELYMEDCEDIANWLFNGDEFVILSTDDLRKESVALYQGVSIGLSYLVMGFFMLLSALLLFVMCRNSLSQTAIGGGVVFILLGGFTSLAAAVVAWIPGLWASIAGSNPALTLVGDVLVINAPIFVTMLAVGILLPVIRAIVKKVTKK